MCDFVEHKFSLIIEEIPVYINSNTYCSFFSESQGLANWKLYFTKIVLKMSLAYFGTQNWNTDHSLSFVF